MFDNRKKPPPESPPGGYASNKGRKRDHNEDSYMADAANGLFVIADGMGGHAGGAVASSIVVDTVRRDVARGVPLDEALQAAHRNLLDAVGNGMGSPGMGAAAVALKMNGAEYHVAWVGDSRAYLWDGRLKRLTHDHSLVQNLLDRGAITEDEARVHPQRNILTQALGAADLPDVRVETVRGRLYQGWKILLCSDGLTIELDDGEIAAIMARNPSDPECVAALIRAANEKEGKDNITVILASSPSHLPGEPDEDTTLTMERKVLPGLPTGRTLQLNPRRTMWAAVLVLLFLFGACGYFFGFNFPPGIR